MSIETFYTAQSSNSQNGAAGRLQVSASANGSKSSAPAAVNGQLGFFDMFLQTAAMALETQKEKAQGQGQQKSIMDTPLEDIPADSPLAKLIDTLPVSEGVEEELAKLDNPTIGDVIALSQQALEQGVVPETQSDVDIQAGAEIETSVTADALSEEEQSDVPEILKGAFLIEDEKNRPALNNLVRILKSIENVIEKADSGLIATDLTPAQITDLQEKVEKLLAGIKNEEQSLEATEDNAENYAAVVLGLIKILPPQAKNDFITTGKAILLGDAAQTSAPQTIGTKDLSTQLNNIVTADDAMTEDGWTPTKNSVLDDFESFLDSMKSEKGGKGLSFEDMLQGKAGNDNAAKNQAALTSVLQNWPFGNSGSLNAPAEYSQQSMDQMGVATVSSQMGSMAAMTSVVTQSHAASQPHPGTQMVAVSLKKGAASGEAKNIRIQLDPPELGRVEIRMEFGKDKTVKAVLTAEKPETFMMLQRDAQVLERALQEAGLEADGDSLSFELAQDNQDFNQDGRHDGSRNPTGKNGDAEGEEEIIETTMTWQVDPESGHIRYNILA